MLVLTRRSDEFVLITTPDGTEIRIGVGDLSNGQAKLLFDAPEGVRIMREELVTK